MTGSGASYEVIGENGPGWTSYRWRYRFSDGSLILSRSHRSREAAHREARAWCSPGGEHRPELAADQTETKPKA